MDTSAERIAPPDTPKKQQRSVAEKRRIVEETLGEGASVARVARTHGVNANQVFQWRRLYRAGRLGGTAGTVKLLPVTVEASAPPAAAEQAFVQPTLAGTIHIKLGQAQIRIEGSPELALLRTVLESLLG